jgi:hypothetical protein
MAGVASLSLSQRTFPQVVIDKTRISHEFIAFDRHLIVSQLHTLYRLNNELYEVRLSQSRQDTYTATGQPSRMTLI